MATPGRLLRDGPLEEHFLGQIAVSFGIKRDRVLAHQWAGCCWLSSSAVVGDNGQR